MKVSIHAPARGATRFCNALQNVEGDVEGDVEGEMTQCPYCGGKYKYLHLVCPKGYIDKKPPITPEGKLSGMKR